MAAQDLTTLADVKAWLAITTGADDALIGGCITAASLYWLWRTGRASLNTEISYSERYDGSGARRQFLRNWPVTAVTLVQVDNVVIPPSPDYIAPGWVVDQSAKSISLIGAGAPVAYAGTRGFTGVPYRYGSPGFRAGVQNVLVEYMAGFDDAPLDVQDAVKKMVAVNYKRRQWVDQSAQTMNGMQTVRYRDWELPPEVVAVMNAYTRRATP